MFLCVFEIPMMFFFLSMLSFFVCYMWKRIEKSCFFETLRLDQVIKIDENYSKF